MEESAKKVKDSAEVERKLTVSLLSDMTVRESDINLSPATKKVEFSQTLATTPVEPMKQQQNLVSPSTKEMVLQTIANVGTFQMERSSSKGGTSSGTSTPVRRRSSPAGSLMNEIRKMSLASQDAKEERQLKRFRRFHGRRRRRREEEYTDKDRAAAVTLGSRDIKQSLRAKKKRERKLCVCTDLLNREDFLSDMLLNEATHQMRIRDISMALSTLDKALELQPSHGTALVARSQCYLKLGDAISALKDAKASCDTRENFMMGLCQYAEALYNLGDFESALIAFHRGYRMRKEMEVFRIGVQKCQEAIEKSIGGCNATKIDNLDEILPIIYEMDNFKNQKLSSSSEDTRDVKVSPVSRSIPKTRWISREVLGSIYQDKAYLTKFLSMPDLRNVKPTAATIELRENALEALEYIQVREEFWRQQNPIYARRHGFNLTKKLGIVQARSQSKNKKARVIISEN